jgi:hypothetical protein
MMGRSTLALLIAGAVVAAPPASRARLFCRWTGEEVTAEECQDRAPGDAPLITGAGCCELRISVPLPAAKSEQGPTDTPMPTVIAVEILWFEVASTARPSRAEPAPPRPPPLSSTRILLI